MSDGRTDGRAPKLAPMQLPVRTLSVPADCPARSFRCIGHCSVMGQGPSNCLQLLHSLIASVASHAGLKGNSSRFPS
ncbi:Hypp9596 [Branchiostoma lanceolatum]|uniref:Hypp9596 protein n=1 Tax=Branchiostoma lanceolatum TaxID=7740 RepID=A0A8S4MN99_BRALA|nr:Hypp9596 [Branchiostoma lanceolatum]